MTNVPFINSITNELSKRKLKSEVVANAILDIAVGNDRLDNLIANGVTHSDLESLTIGGLTPEQTATIEKIAGLNSSASEIDGKVIPVDTIALLRAKIVTPSTVWVSGYYTKGDGAFGSNIFEWDSTSIEDDNSGTIIKLTSITTGRYKLKFSGAVNVKWFGVTEFIDSSLNTLYFSNALTYTSINNLVLDLNAINITVESIIEIRDKDHFSIVNGMLKRGVSIPLGTYMLKFLRCTDFTISGVDITGENDGSSSILFGDYGIKLEGCRRAIIKRSTYSMFKDSALTIESEEITNTESTDITVTMCKFNNIFQVSTTQNGVSNIRYMFNRFKSMGGSPKFATQDERAIAEFSGNLVDSTSDGVRMSGYRHSIVKNNEISNCDNGVFIETTTTAATANDVELVEISRNLIENINTAIYIKNSIAVDGTSTVIGDVVIERNTIKNILGNLSDDGGIIITGKKVKNIKLIDNTIDNITKSAITITCECDENSTISSSGNKITNGGNNVDFTVDINPVLGVFAVANFSNDVIRKCGGSRFKNIHNYTISNYRELEKKTQTVIESCISGILVDSIFTSNTGISGVRITATDLMISNTKITSDAAFALRTEAACSDIREDLNTINGIRVMFVSTYGRFSGVGVPIIPAMIGSTYTNKSGGANTTLYVKEALTSSSGWVGK